MTGRLMVGARERVKRSARVGLDPGRARPFQRSRTHPCPSDVPFARRLTADPLRTFVAAMAKRAMRVAAIDLGKARVGLAVADELGMMAHARPPLDGKSRKALIAALVALCREEKLTRFLVGLPLEMNGGEGPAARRALEFAQQLADASGVEIEMVDERLSTVEASRRLRDGGLTTREQRGKVDGAAAAVILQGWLDARGS